MFALLSAVSACVIGSDLLSLLTPRPVRASPSALRVEALTWSSYPIGFPVFISRVTPDVPPLCSGSRWGFRSIYWFFFFAFSPIGHKTHNRDVRLHWFHSRWLKSLNAFVKTNTGKVSPWAEFLAISTVLTDQTSNQSMEIQCVNKDQWLANKTISEWAPALTLTWGSQSSDILMVDRSEG